MMRVSIQVPAPDGATHYFSSVAWGKTAITWYKCTQSGGGEKRWNQWSERSQKWHGHEQPAKVTEIRTPDLAVPTVARLSPAGPVGTRDVVFVPGQLSSVHGEDLVRRSDHTAAMEVVVQENAELRQKVSDILADLGSV
jgi:hypothetical protein